MRHGPGPVATWPKCTGMACGSSQDPTSSTGRRGSRPWPGHWITAPGVAISVARGHQRGEGFNAGGFRRALERWGEGADWVVLPDIVGGGLASLDMSREWRDEVSAAGRPVLLAVQDGMEPHHIRDELGPNVGIFVGGTTDWKERTISTWGTLARAVGCYLHIGRVNTIRRTQLAVDAGADSIDGTTVSKYAVTAEKMARACRTEPRPELPFGVTT